MKKSIFLLLFTAFSCFVSAQNTVECTVLEAVSNNPLAYVNIGVVGENRGTVSDISGHFQLNLDSISDEKELLFSMIGYEDLQFTIQEFKAKIDTNTVFLMQKNDIELTEVVVSSSKLRSKILGNTTTSKMMQGGFSSNELGNEVGIFIKIKERPTWITEFNTSIVSSKFDTLKFRLNIYSVKNKMPHKNLLRAPIYLESTIKSGILSIDLSEYNIVVEEDIFVSLEWIEELGEVQNGLYFSMRFFGNKLAYRQSSQAPWKSLKAASIGFNIVAKY